MRIQQVFEPIRAFDFKRITVAHHFKVLAVNSCLVATKSFIPVLAAQKRECHFAIVLLTVLNRRYGKQPIMRRVNSVREFVMRTLLADA